ncbi:MAG: nif-specific transcriptional activator NifA [Thiohalomonadaceae bacterium]
MERTLLLEKQLNCIYEVSRVLSRSLHLQETLREVLQVLHDVADMQHGMVTLREPECDELFVSAVHDGNGIMPQTVRYRAGEGVIGTISQLGRRLVVRRIAEEPRFLGRLGIHDPELPFIGVPIQLGDDTLGVLAAQPAQPNDDLLEERADFLEMVANLIAQTVRLAGEVARERRHLTDERDRLRTVVRSRYGFDNMVGHTAAMRRVFEQIEQVAKWNTTVLIRGESGTGKELAAHAIHYNSPRATGPFIRLNCAALPDNLLESELFGHEKGAFTGAITQRKGRFEQADGGTLFLDEIGEISPNFQAKLLRVLQEGEFERVGGTRTLRVDVRIIAATNRDLEALVEEGKFREDLYYRLNVMPIFVPSLRNRAEDIPDLARFLVEKIGNRHGRSLAITDSALRALMRYDWPGNVRELENCLERAAVMSANGVIDADAIAMTGLEEKTATRSAPVAVDLTDPNLSERERVIAALEQSGWVQAKAARLLNMTPRQIAYRIQILNIKLRRF